MDAYTLTLERRLWNRRLKRVVAHFYPADLNPPGVAIRYMFVIFKDESRMIVDMSKYNGIRISKEMHFINLKRAEEDSQGQFKGKS